MTLITPIVLEGTIEASSFAGGGLAAAATAVAKPAIAQSTRSSSGA